MLRKNKENSQYENLEFRIRELEQRVQKLSEKIKSANGLKKSAQANPSHNNQGYMNQNILPSYQKRASSLFKSFIRDHFNNNYF